MGIVLLENIDLKMDLLSYILCCLPFERILEMCDSDLLALFPSLFDPDIHHLTSIGNHHHRDQREVYIEIG